MAGVGDESCALLIRKFRRNCEQRGEQRHAKTNWKLKIIHHSVHAITSCVSVPTTRGLASIQFGHDFCLSTSVMRVNRRIYVSQIENNQPESFLLLLLLFVCFSACFLF